MVRDQVKEASMGQYSTIDSCAGCAHEEGFDGAICKIYDRPAAKWRALGGCPSATNRAVVVKETKERVGQQKQKKAK
jgi:hypothetical protein